MKTKQIILPKIMNVVTILVMSFILFPTVMAQQYATPTPPKDYKGVMKLDVSASTPDWSPYIRKKAPEGSPNILFILYDDTGLATWSPFGGRVNMPTLDKLAADGLIYTQWHTVALCSPTRSCILTGRNHNLNGMGSITEGANGFPRLQQSYTRADSYNG